MVGGCFSPLTTTDYFAHENIIRFCDRPFKSIGEMDAELIRRWNEVVGEKDTVYHLGDFTLSGKKVAAGYFQRLNGQIKVLGYPWHHDRKWIGGQYDRVEVLPPMVMLKMKGYPPITLCHFPLESWPQGHHGAVHFHSHSHGKMPVRKGRLDVGVDSWDFAPVSLERAMESLS